MTNLSDCNSPVQVALMPGGIPREHIQWPIIITGEAPPIYSWESYQVVQWGTLSQLLESQQLLEKWPENEGSEAQKSQFCY